MLTSTASGQFARMLELVTNSLSVQIAAAFLIVLGFKWPVLYDPPVWDTAMSVFPAAITLVEFDFDFLRLLQQPGYDSVGPNVHADSLVTLITAVLVKLTAGTGLLLPSVHLLHFTITALTLVATYRYGRPLLGETISVLCALAVFFFPLFFVQAGYMYLEMPLTFAAMMALLAWRNERFLQAAGWAVVAMLIKQTGIVVAGAFFVGILTAPWPVKTKLYRISVLALLSLLFAIFQLTILKETGGSSAGLGLAVHQCIIPAFWRYNLRVPDLTFFLVLFFIVSAVYGKVIWRGLRSPSDDSSGKLEGRTLALSAVVTACLVAFLYTAFPLMAGGCNILPRYYVMVLPCVFTTLSYGLVNAAGRPLAALVIIGFILFFCFNREGVFYPSDVDTEGPGNNFALVERSYAYRQLAAVQREAMAFLAERVPRQAPILFGHHEGYLNRYPLMGYVDKPMENARSAYALENSEVWQIVREAPDCLYFLYNYPWLGGVRIRFIMGQLVSTHDLDRVKTFQRGRYKIHLVRATRKGEVCHEEADGTLSRL